ncbi:MAG TPA: PKD domain-containing protein [Vicingaceae bacterium]
MKIKVAILLLFGFFLTIFSVKSQTIGDPMCSQTSSSDCCIQYNFDFNYTQQVIAPTPPATLSNQVKVNFTLTSVLGVTTTGSRFTGICSEHEVASVSWDFDDDELVDVISDAPAYVYTFSSACASEVHKVVVCVLMSNGATCRFEQWIVLNNPNVVASHTITPTINACGQVDFAYTGTTLTNPKWTFGDGTFDNSGQQTVSHTYPSNGTYTVTLTNDELTPCAIAATVTISDKPRASFSYTLPDVCNLTSGINVTINNYNPSLYTYLWKVNNVSVPATGVTTNITSPLVSGQNNTIKLIVQDASSCQSATSQNIKIGAVEADFNTPLEYCLGDLLNVTGIQSGGTTYDWKIENTTTSTTVNLTNAGMFPSYQFTTAGTYEISLTVTTTYPNPSNPSSPLICTDLFTETVEVFEQVDASFSIASGTNCGEIALTLTNPTTTTAYTINYGDGTVKTGTDITSAPSTDLEHIYTSNGVHAVTITLTNGTCTNTKTNSVSINDQATLTIVASNTNLCPGSSVTLNAVIANVVIGSGGITYAWEDITNPLSPISLSGTTAQITVTSGGTYQVTVTTGSNICFSNNDNDATIVINELEAPTATFDVQNITATSCGLSTGEVTLDVTANLAAVGYTIDGGAVQNTLQTTIENLPAGPNYITIANAQDPTCTGTVLVNIPDDSPEVEVVTIDATCGASGSITVNGVPGGYSTTVYAANDYPSTPLFTGTSGNVPAGNYVVEVTENSPGSCVVTQNITVLGGTFNLSLVNPNLGICSGGSVEAALDNPPSGAVITWNTPGASSTISQPGEYSVTVTDGSCTETLYFTVQQFDPITINFEIIQPLCPGYPAQINAIVAGGSGNYTYSWSNSASTDDNISIPTAPGGTVILTVNDANTALGCGPASSPDLSTGITFPDPIVLCAITTQTPAYVGTDAALAPSATYENNISITGCELELCATGGTAPLNYEWFLEGQPSTETRIVSFTVNGVTGALEYNDPDPSSPTFGNVLAAEKPTSVTIPGYTSGTVAFNVNDPNITVTPTPTPGFYIYPYWMYDGTNIFPAFQTDGVTPFTVTVQVTVTNDIMVHNHTGSTTSTADFADFADPNGASVTYTLVITDANGCSTSFPGVKITIPPVPDFPEFSFVWAKPGPSTGGEAPEEVDINLKDNMAEAANEMMSSTMACLQSQTQGMITAFEDNCFDLNTFRDSTNISYEVNEHHYTLYYYDRAGKLTKTVPPQGVKFLDDGSISSNEIQAIIDYRAASPSNLPAVSKFVPDHTMETQYQHNSLGQLISQNTPDGGTSNFIYDGLNRLRFSQNEQQNTDGVFSYTKYDELGRIIEVGESNATGLNFVDPTLAANVTTYANDVNYPDNTLAGIINTEITKTHYTTPAQVNYYGLPQRYLQNRVSFVFNDEDGDLNTTNDQYHTYFSYDTHGNVEWLIQEDAEIGKNYIAYEYDLISGNVTKVRYNENRSDKFFHRYEYDAENRLTHVFTSTDNQLWDNDAHYEYYAHGPLKRNTLGEDHVQGLDYIYTIHGWLKSINSPNISNNTDPGNDGDLVTAINAWQQTNKVAEDYFGMSLGYYNGDYRNVNNFHYNSTTGASPYQNLYASTNNDAADLYNGNISHWVHSQLSTIGGLKDPSVKPRASVYNYDVLNRIKQSTNFEQIGGDLLGNYAFSTYTGVNGADAYKTNYTYDANGNLLNLDRYNALGILMDELGYTYDNGLAGVALNSNQLTSVTDNSTNTEDGRGDLEATHTYTYDGIGNLTIETAQERMDFGAGYQLFDVATNISWTVYGKVKQVTKTISTNSGANVYQVEKIDFEYDASGNRIKKTANKKIDAAGSLSGTDANPETANFLVNEITTTYYVRDAQGNTLAVYEKTAVENGSNFDVTLQLKEQPIYGSDRLGQRTANKVLAASLGVSGSSNNIIFNPLGSGIQKKSEYQNWITSSNKHALIDATNQLCQQKVIHLEYNSTEYATPTTPDIPATTNFLGIAKNGVAIAENTDGELQFYVVLAEKYLGNKDACLIYDATGKLMKNTELISNIDINSKPIVINLAINKYAVITLNANKQPMYHIVDMDAQGYGTLTNAGEVDATQVNVAMTTTTTAQYGLHFTAYEDHVNNKKIVYSTRYTPNVALPDQGTTEIVAFEFINNTTQLQQHVLYQINGCGNTEQGELQIAPEGDKLLWYQHDKYVTGFSHRVFDVYSIALHPDKISTTGIVDILDHTLVNNYGGNYGEGRAEYDADNQTMYLSQRGIYLDGASGNESERNLWKYSPLNTTTLNPLNPTSVYLFSEIRRGVNGKLYMPNMDAAADAIHSYDGSSMSSITTNSNYSSYHFASALPTQVYKLFGEEIVASTGREIGKKQYFLNDHLGSVRVIISDEKHLNNVNSNDQIDAGDYFSPFVVSFSDTYPFGMSLRNFNPNLARYSFQGQEKEKNAVVEGFSFKYRIHDARIGRFLSTDPLTRSYPKYTPYSFSHNRVIDGIELEGLEFYKKGIVREFGYYLVQGGKSMDNVWVDTDTKMFLINGRVPKNPDESPIESDIIMPRRQIIDKNSFRVPGMLKDENKKKSGLLKTHAKWKIVSTTSDGKSLILQHYKVDFKSSKSNFSKGAGGIADLAVMILTEVSKWHKITDGYYEHKSMLKEKALAVDQAFDLVSLAKKNGYIPSLANPNAKNGEILPILSSDLVDYITDFELESTDINSGYGKFVALLGKDMFENRDLIESGRYDIFYKFEVSFEVITNVYGVESVIVKERRVERTDNLELQELVKALESFKLKN